MLVHKEERSPRTNSCRHVQPAGMAASRHRYNRPTTRIFPGAHINSDDFLVMMTITPKMRTYKKNSRINNQQNEFSANKNTISSHGYLMT